MRLAKNVIFLSTLHTSRIVRRLVIRMSSVASLVLLHLKSFLAVGPSSLAPSNNNRSPTPSRQGFCTIVVASQKSQAGLANCTRASRFHVRCSCLADHLNGHLPITFKRSRNTENVNFALKTHRTLTTRFERSTDYNVSCGSLSLLTTEIYIATDSNKISNGVYVKHFFIVLITRFF